MDRSNRSLRLTSTSTALREVKAQGVEFQALLQRKQPFDRDVEALRDSLRKSYIEILFSPYISSNSSVDLGSLKSSSYSARLSDVMNLLWLETSHALIVIYRNKVTELDKAMAEQPVGSRGGANRGGRGGGPAGRGGVGPTARRKLLQTFRNFLSNEEDFFRDLLSRFTDSLPVTDSALPGLRSLGITISSDLKTASEIGDDEIPPSPSSESMRLNRERVIPLAHKALICFGDLARYRELYKEVGSGGDGKKDNGKKGRKTESEKKVKNWKQSQECYHQARLLIPDNGNPSNQLAVLSNYDHDTLSSSYHYYRALTVKSPFPTARTNLQITYGKVVAKWFSAEGPEIDGDEGVQFRAAFVALHGLFYLRERIGDIAALQTEVEHLFKISVTERLLSSDLIVKTAVTGLCALYNARMLRSTSVKKNGERSKSKDALIPSTDLTTPTINLEPNILIHVLSLFRILLSVGTSETDELVASNLASGSSLDANSNISAVLRRTLPALRILSKYIIGQLDYIGRIETRLMESEKKVLASEDSTGISTQADLKKEVNKFWFAYCNFANSIKAAFPIDLLPTEVAVWLEEDVDMLGFAPLKKGMKEGLAGDGTLIEISRVGKDVHPNEEQLMRIAEIQRHSILVADSESSPIILNDEQFSSPNYVPEPSPKITSTVLEAASVPFDPSLLVRSSLAIESPEEEYDFDLEDITEDDPVDLAMRIAEASEIQIDGDDDDDDEDIVYRVTRSAPQLLPRPNSYSPNLLHQLLSGQNTNGNGTTRASPPNNTSFNPTASPPSLGHSIWSNNFANTSINGSFESLPNMTHQAFGTRNSPSRVLPPPSPYQNQYFEQPNFANQPLPPPSSELSARADSFNFAPSSDPAINSAGWPQLQSTRQKLPPPKNYSSLPFHNS